MSKAKIIIVSVVAALVLIVLFQNRQSVDVTFLFFPVTMPCIVLLAITAALGFASGAWHRIDGRGVSLAGSGGLRHGGFDPRAVLEAVVPEAEGGVHRLFPSFSEGVNAAREIAGAR